MFGKSILLVNDITFTSRFPMSTAALLPIGGMLYSAMFHGAPPRSYHGKLA